MKTLSLDRAQARMQRLVSEGRDVAGFFAVAGEVLESALEVGPELQYWCAVDPSTYLMTSVHAPTCDMDLDALMHWEYVEDDFNKTADIARHPEGGPDPARRHRWESRAERGIPRLLPSARA